MQLSTWRLEIAEEMDSLRRITIFSTDFKEEEEKDKNYFDKLCILYKHLANRQRERALITLQQA